MAAKPPKPPGNFLKSLLNQHNNKNKVQQNHNDNVNRESCDSLQNSTTATTSATTATTSNLADSDLTTQIAAGKKNNCNCSNISIMHLFHEMKQEFPTLPDTIVAQCVNENCHQRENCIQMLKHELELNPIPAQSYPAKVLHPPSNNINHLQNTIAAVLKPPLQQKPLVVQQKPPLKPIRPTRMAPLQPPQPQQANGNTNFVRTNSTLNKNINKPLSGENIKNSEEFVGNSSNGAGGFVDASDGPIRITPHFKQVTTNTTTISEVCNNNENDKNYSGIGDENIEKNMPRQRPTTLNLNSQVQKQQQHQRQRLNIQLQQRFQEQRNRQQLQNNTTITKPIRKAPLPPIAPKPSQLQSQQQHNNNTNDSLNDSFLHTSTSPLSESEISVSVSLSTPSPTSSLSPNTTTHHHHHLLNKTTQPQAPTTYQQQQQHMQTKSPIRHRSVINLQPEPPYTRDFLFTSNSPTYNASATPPSATSPTLPAPKSATATNSSSSSTTSPTASVTGSQKSFTSVNLTLRPPVSPSGPNSALQPPSTIDITAGPGFSGASGGGKSLHYSSTSYDARLGYQQNFQITVTDECGVFTASRIRPKQPPQQRCLNQVNLNNYKQYDNNTHSNYINSFFNAQQQQQFHNNNVVALQQNIQNSIQTSSGFGSGSGGGNMCFPLQQTMDASTQEILLRQKKKRDKLAAALREYKKRLGNVEQEINLLTGTIPTEGLSERLDEEITKLRRDCQDMLRSSNTFTQPHLQQELAIDHQPQQMVSQLQQQQQQQQPPQPFPRQKATRPSSHRAAPPRQTSLDIIQHHSQTSSPHTSPAPSLPNLNLYSSLQLQQLQQSNHPMPTAYYHQQLAPSSSNFVNNNEDFYSDHSTYVEQDHVLDEDADEYEEVIEQPWECNMCTFRNHPQLNICETCENVRIIPGRLTNLSRALSATNCINSSDAAGSSVCPTLGLLRGSSSNNAINNSSSSTHLNAAANANLEHDTNLVQQQLQHFALHT